jgi:ZIP family zinc transporter
MINAIALGAIAQSALLVAGILAYYVKLPQRFIGWLAGFGTGALLVAIMLTLVPEEQAALGNLEVGLWLLVGAFIFILADRAVLRKYGGEGSGSSMGIVLGAVVDGIPESAIFGIQLAIGVPISPEFFAAIWISNVPQSFAPSSDLAAGGMTKSKMALMWGSVVVVCGVAAGIGYFLASRVSDVYGARMAGVAAGGLLAMITNSFIPFAYERGGEYAGFGTVVGVIASLIL